MLDLGDILCNNYRALKIRGVAQLGRALRSGRRGRGFKSRHLDHKALYIAILESWLMILKWT